MKIAKNICFGVVMVLILGMFTLFKPYVVLSGSMEPLIHTGSVVFVKPTNDVKIDDVITFRLGGVIVTHRYIEDIDGEMVTKGDANESEDIGRITKSDVIGKALFSIPFLGYGIALIQDNILLAALWVCIAVAIFIVTKKLIISKENNK